MGYCYFDDVSLLGLGLHSLVSDCMIQYVENYVWCILK